MRARIWASSLILITRHPFIGVGKKGKAMIGEIGTARASKTGDKVTYDIIHSVHGGLLNIVVRAGLIGLALFLFGLFLLFRHFSQAAQQGIAAGVVGNMFLAGTLISQVGASIYGKPLFWVVLGIILVAVHDEKRQALEAASS